MAGGYRRFARIACSNTARGGEFDLILTDLNYTRDTTSGQEGMDLLASLEAQGNTVPVVVMTAWGNVDLAVEAMRRGACDFVQKPWDNNRLLATIRKQAEPVRKRKSELEIAANVQQKLFPRKSRRLATLDYAGHCMPAREVGGDYYDFLDISDHAIGFVLGDVSGKGVPAALLMANLQACFRSQSPQSLERPAAVLATVNKHFFDSTAAERFATLVFAAYDDRTRKIRYVNCAHCPPLLLRAGGEIEQSRIHRDHAGRVRAVELRGSAAPSCAPATPCCCIPTASPKPGANRAKNSATTG